MTRTNLISNPHYAKPLHVRVAFALWLTWRNSPALRGIVNGLGLTALFAATAALLIAVLVF